MRILKENTTGLIIDIQERLFPVMAEKEKLLKNCRVLVQGLKVLSLPLLITQQYTRGLGETIPEIKELITDFSYIEKRAFSCCDEPVFMKKLQDLKVQNVVICGIESHVCVLQTAVDLKVAGFNPIIIMNCVSSRELESIDLAKERFRHEGILMASCESILFEITRDSSAAEFREISKLVK